MLRIQLLQRVIGFAIVLLVIPSPAFPNRVEKLTATEVIQRHLESVGASSVRDAVKTRIISGNSLVVFRTVPTGQASGLGVLASEGNKNLIGMSFRGPVYPREEFAFDGSSFLAAFVTPGVRSSLGSFLMQQNGIFKNGLMGGILSSSWPLFDPEKCRSNVEYGGKKKVSGQSVNELKYTVRGSDLQISLYFDEASSRHVRTEYRRLVAAVTGDRGYGNIQERESRYKLVEEFSDFKPEGGLSLPHTYKIEFSADTQSGTFLGEWTLTLNRFVFNEKIEPSSFTISTYKN